MRVRTEHRGPAVRPHRSAAARDDGAAGIRQRGPPRRHPAVLDDRARGARARPHLRIREGRAAPALARRDPGAVGEQRRSPIKADFLAQANNSGGGESDTVHRPSQPLSSPLPKALPGVAPIPLEDGAPRPTPPSPSERLTQRSSDFSVATEAARVAGVGAPRTRPNATANSASSRWRAGAGNPARIGAVRKAPEAQVHLGQYQGIRVRRLHARAGSRASSASATSTIRTRRAASSCTASSCSPWACIATAASRAST